VLPNTVIKPPEDFKPDTKNGYAWCPYCGQAHLFVWDAELAYSRCPGCGISADDWYVRTFNRLWDVPAKGRFDAAVRESGRRWERGGGDNDSADRPNIRDTKPEADAVESGAGADSDGTEGASSLLPRAVLGRVRALVAAECANFAAALEGYPRNSCLTRDAACVYFGGRGRWCRWFEEAVLPLDRRLQGDYWDARMKRNQ